MRGVTKMDIRQPLQFTLQLGTLCYYGCTDVTFSLGICTCVKSAVIKTKQLGMGMKGVMLLHCTYCIVLHCSLLYCTALPCNALYCSALYCFAMHYTVLHCTALHYLYCSALYCIVLYCIALYCIALYCTVLHCIVLFCIALYCIALYCTVLYCIVLYCIVLYCIALYCTVLHCIVLNFIVLCCTVLHCIAVNCTALYCKVGTELQLQEKNILVLFCYFLIFHDLSMHNNAILHYIEAVYYINVTQRCSVTKISKNNYKKRSPTCLKVFRVEVTVI